MTRFRTLDHPMIGMIAWDPARPAEWINDHIAIVHGDVVGQDRDGVTRPDGLTRRWQGHVDGLGDQYRRIPLGAQHRESVVEGGLGVGAGDIDPLAGVGPVLAGQRAHRLPGQRQRRAITEMFGLGPGQSVQIRGGGECGTGRGDGVGQRGLRQQIGRWLTHATELS